VGKRETFAFYVVRRDASGNVQGAGPGGDPVPTGLLSALMLQVAIEGACSIVHTPKGGGL
jgi:hypothetical protein